MFIFVVPSLTCVQLCDPMGCSTPGFPVLHHLLKLAQIHVQHVYIGAFQVALVIKNLPMQET